MSLDLKIFNTSSVKNMQYMFYNCQKLISLDLSNFNTSLVTDMQYMFYNCSNLRILDLSIFNTSLVKNMFRMFYKCSNLISVDLSSFDTSSVTDINGMFYECSNLISVDLSNFNISSVNDMRYMFTSCNENLTYCINQTNNLLSNITSTSNYKFKNNNNCSNICFYKDKKIILDTKKCVFDCNEIYKYEYNNICYSSCPNGTHNITNNICIKNNNENINVII